MDAQVRPATRRVPPVEHVVFFPSADGTPEFRRLSSLEEAVRLVEHLRNVESVDAASVHALTEVPLSFKAYYRVEVPSVQDVPVPVPVLEVAVADVPVAEVPVQGGEQVLGVEPVPSLALVEDLPVDPPELIPSNGNGADSVPSLGFFA